MRQSSAPTTVQSLGSLLKSARDIMRKDKGLNGDLDRLPLLTWIMFLKFLDDLEVQREEEAKLSGKSSKPQLNIHTAGAIGPRNPTDSPAMTFSASSTTKKPCCPIAKKAQVSFAIFAR